ncbi:MAG: respiratory nitrate reductase subunit gamma [Acidobacteriia bacterium]|nr:respiratory nitrate reductase subunit gamma [Terriglobia bacterium]
MTPAFLFSLFPYLAVALLIVGVLVRYLMARRRPETMAAESVVKSKDALEALASGKAWRVSLLALLLLHFVELVLPRGILWWNSISARLYLLEGTAFAAGVVALGCWAAVMWKNLRRSGRSAVTELSDMVFLALLFAGILSGLALAVIDRWGSTWGVMTLTPYVMSVLRGNPAFRLVSEMPFLVRLHVFSAFAALAILPGTRLSSVLVLGLHRSLLLMGRPFIAIGRFVDAWLQKHNPAGRIWPEED